MEGLPPIGMTVAAGGGTREVASIGSTTCGSTPAPIIDATSGKVGGAGGAGTGGRGGVACTGPGCTGSTRDDGLARGSSTARASVVGEASGALSAPGSGLAPSTVVAPSCSSSHAQFQVQAQAQSRGVSLPPLIAIDVVTPQNVNDQIHVQGALKASPDAGGEAGSSASGCDGVILRGPSDEERSPEAGSSWASGSGWASGDALTASETALGSPISELAHAQSHVQSHTQTSDPGLPVSLDDELALPAQSISRIQSQYHDSVGD